MTLLHSIRRRHLLATLLVVTGTALLIPGIALSGGLGQTGHWEYVPTPYSQSVPNDCPANLDCWELCFVGVDGSQATGQLCCVDESGTCIEGLR